MENKALATIWRTPAELWERIEPVILAKDPPHRKGRKRVAPRLILDTLIHRLRSGCQWNQLPSELADDSSAHRTFQRWQAVGVFDAIWALLVESCAELGGVDWEWQAAAGALGKSGLGEPDRAGCPLNSLTAQWQLANDPAQWSQMRTHWHFFQGVRGGLFLAAFVLLAVASVLPWR